MKRNFANYLVEFIGTFFLVFTVGCCAFGEGSGLIPAIAIGFVLMVMVYAGGHISGGHYNPAVSFAAAIRGALQWKQIVQYFIAQILGAVVAALAVKYVVVLPAIESMPVFNIPALIIGEFLFTFALCYVVLLTAAEKPVEGNSYYGLAIGSTVTAGAFSAGSYCLAAFNPAVVAGLAVMGVVNLQTGLITAAVNLLAGACAALVFRFVSTEEN